MAGRTVFCCLNYQQGLSALLMFPEATDTLEMGVSYAGSALQPPPLPTYSQSMGISPQDSLLPIILEGGHSPTITEQGHGRWLDW